MWRTKLSERTMKDICRCEDPYCDDTVLTHFQECPRCKSKSYHLVVKRFEDEEN